MELQQVTRAPVVVNVVGATSAERKLSVMETADMSVRFALASAKGNVGKAARAGVAEQGLVDMTMKAAWPTCDYRPVAQYLAAQLGEGMVISSRATFKALPDFFEARIMKIKTAKNCGYRTDKDGLQTPTAAHTLALQLKAECVEIIRASEEVSARRKAEHEAKKAEQAKLLANDPTAAA